MERPVILLFGSHNSEHMVSVASAQNLAKFLPTAALWYWTPSGPVLEVTHEALAAHQNPFLEDFAPASSLATWPSIEAALDSDKAHASVFFLAVHGSVVEDGTLQQWLETRHIPFTGSSSHSSYLAFHKTLAKDVLQKAGVPVAPSFTLHSHVTPTEKQQLLDMIEQHHKIVLKPVADGSSVGLYFASNAAELDVCLDQLQSQPSRLYMAEAFVTGTELTVGVIQRANDLMALPCTEIRSEKGQVFDYLGKYLGKGSREITPAEVPEAWGKAAQELAVKAHEMLLCRGYSRTDVMVSNEGAVFIELNSLPGLTEASLIPQQLATAGIHMQDFVNEQLAIALKQAEGAI